MNKIGLQEGDLIMCFNKDGTEYGVVMHFNYEPTYADLKMYSKHLVNGLAKKLQLKDGSN